MKWRSGTLFAVSTKDFGLDAVEFWRHFRMLHDVVNALKIFMHITETFGADGAYVIGLFVLVKALHVHGMPAREKCDWRRGREHKLCTHRTTRFQATLHALVFALERNRQANIARIAVKEIALKSYATHIALGAMKDILVLAVIVKAALRAKVP